MNIVSDVRKFCSHTSKNQFNQTYTDMVEAYKMFPKSIKKLPFEMADFMSILFYRHYKSHALLDYIKFNLLDWH